MIRARKVVKYHGTNRILDEATLDARPGEMTALVGPSGGGKSTLLRCINGLEPFDSGQVDVFGLTLPGTNGKPHADALLQQVRRKVGMVFQQFHLFPHMTAVENVMSGPRFALNVPVEQARQTAVRLLQRVGLGDKLDSRPANLSGGQQQRVAIARALAVNPAAILFDEPTSALDPQMVGEVLAVMRDLASDGETAMIVVTHDTDFARQAAIVHKMVAGRVAASGPPDQVLTA